jgi:hypothetical protein
MSPDCQCSTATAIDEVWKILQEKAEAFGKQKIMSKMKRLTRDAILNIDDFKMEDVDVPEWGGVVTLKSMNGTERDAFEASLMSTTGDKRPNMANIRAKLVATTAIDPDTRELLFSVADIELLGTKSAAGLDRLFSVAQRLSKISETDIDGLVKN